MPYDLRDATFSLSAQTAPGLLFSLPQLGPSQAAALSVGTVEKRPTAIGDMLAVRSKAYLALRFDQRAIDESLAIQFMSQLKRNIESFPEEST